MTAAGQPDPGASCAAGPDPNAAPCGDDSYWTGHAWAEEISHSGPAVVDAHDIVAEKFRRILATADNVDVVAIATNAAQALEKVLRREPHVIVMDYRLPDGDEDGVTAATEIRAHVPATKILIVIGSDQPGVRDAALESGSTEDVRGTLALDRMLDSLQHATHATNNLSQLTTAGDRHRDHVGSLTRRQAEILAIMAEGLTDQAIAERLTLSLNTVRTHVQTILRKLGAHSKLEAVAIATRRHLLGERA